MGHRDSTRRAACAAVALLLSASSAQALDCAKASTPLERAICGSPSAAASDVGMVTAFEGVRARLEGTGQQDSRKAALVDQRIWLKTRNSECSILKSKEDRATCAEQQNISRTRILNGSPEAGPGLPRQPLSFFARRSARPDQFEMEARVYRYDAPQSDAEKLVNKRADMGLKGEPSGTSKWGGDSPVRYVHKWTLSYGSSRLLSIQIQQWEYKAGAQSWGSSWALNLDWTSDSEFAVASNFDASALKQLTQFCVGTTKPESARLRAGHDSNRLREAIEFSLSDASSWVFGREGAVIELGLVDGNAAGHYTCQIPYTTLDPLAKRPYR